jgi:hypothetical protein
MTIRAMLAMLVLLVMPVAGPAPVAAQSTPTVPDQTGERVYLIDTGEGGVRLGPERVAVGADTVIDPSSGLIFPKSVAVTTFDGRTIPFQVTGTGVRKKMMFKVYAAALYVDGSVPLPPPPLETLSVDDLPRRLVMTFLRDVDEEKIQEAYREGLIDKVWKAQPGPELADQVDSFLDYFKGGVRKGESIELTYLPGEGLYTVVGGKPKPVVADPNIARGVWRVWLGNEPVSQELRRDLVRLVTPER